MVFDSFTGISVTLVPQPAVAGISTKYGKFETRLCMQSEHVCKSCIHGWWCIYPKFKILCDQSINQVDLNRPSVNILHNFLCSI